MIIFGIAKKILWIKSQSLSSAWSAWLSNNAFHLQLFWMQKLKVYKSKTWLQQFRIMPKIISNLKRAAIWSAVQFKWNEKQTPLSSLGVKDWRTISVSHCFVCSIFDNSMKINWQTFSVTLALRLYIVIYNAIITPMNQQASICDRVLTPGSTSSVPKQWKSDFHVKSSNPVRARSPIPRKRIKRVHLSLTDSMPLKMAAGIFSIQQGTHVTRLTATSLKH